MSTHRQDGSHRDPLENITPREAVRLSIGRRLREIREALFGAYDMSKLCELLSVTEDQWFSYEDGVMMPAEISLAFIDATGVMPHWLLTGRGDRYRAGRWIMQPHIRN